MEAKASWVGGGSHSKEGSMNSSIQGQMEEEVERIGVRPNKVGVEKKGRVEKEGVLDLGRRKRFTFLC